MEINKEKNDHSDRTELKKLSALLDKYVKGECTEEEQRAIESWYETLSGERETSASEESSAKDRIWTGIRSASASLDLKPVKVLEPSQRQWLQWAASIVLFCVSLVLIIRYTQKQELPSSRSAMSTDNWMVQRNSNAYGMRLVLPDSSRIILKPNAIVSYPESFDGSERLVTLKGEAFFEIEEDRERPFKVITGEITTRVLGTSFNIKAIDEQAVIEVDVRTGKVSVYEHTHEDPINSEGVVLTPNQKVTYYKKEKKWVAELVRDPLPVEVDDEAAALVFRDEALRKVLNRIATLYYLDIVVVNESIYDCPFTGDVSHMELYDMLKLICKSIGAEYEVRGTRIVIDGRGCP